MAAALSGVELNLKGKCHQKGTHKLGRQGRAPAGKGRVKKGHVAGLFGGLCPSAGPLCGGGAQPSSLL